MKISYHKLFEILDQKNITKTELRENIKISSATLAKLSKKEPIDIDDIIEFHNYFDKIHPFQDGNVTQRCQQKIT